MPAPIVPMAMNRRATQSPHDEFSAFNTKRLALIFWGNSPIHASNFVNQLTCAALVDCGALLARLV